MNKQRGKTSFIFLYLTIACYTCILLSIILFKYVSPFELFKTFDHGFRSVNLIPFKEIWVSHMSQGFNQLNIFGNIILLIPMGIYLQILMKNKSVLRSLSLVFATSMFLEIFQFVFGIGATDVNDIILNSLGGFIGIMIYRLFLMILKEEQRVTSFVTWLGGIAGGTVLGLIMLLVLVN